MKLYSEITPALKYYNYAVTPKKRIKLYFGKSRLQKFLETQEKINTAENIPINELQEPLTNMIVKMLKDPRKKTELIEFAENTMPTILETVHKVVKLPCVGKFTNVNPDVIEELKNLKMDPFKGDKSEIELRPLVSDFAGRIIKIVKDADIPHVAKFIEKIRLLDNIINPPCLLKSFFPKTPPIVRELHQNCIKVAQNVQKKT